MKNTMYKHIAFSLSYTLPILVVSGILFSLGFFATGSFGAFLIDVGGYAYYLSFIVLAGSIAYAIGDRTAIVPAIIGGYLLKDGSVGLLGAVVIGLFTGYLAKGFVPLIQRIPRLLQGIFPVFILPVILSALTIGLTYVMNIYCSDIMHGMYQLLFYQHHWLIVIFSIVFGACMAFDLGGYVNKIVYFIALLSLADGMSSTVLAAVIAAGMVPPIAVALIQLMKPKMSYPYSWWMTGMLGACFLTEGAIPYVQKNPKINRMLFMIGSGMAGGIVGFYGLSTRIPHGGIFISLFMNQWYIFVLAIMIGAFVSMILLLLFSKQEKQQKTPLQE